MKINRTLILAAELGLDGKPAGPKPEPRSWMEPAEVSARSNLTACDIVPLDAKKRGPEERAAMLEKIGIQKCVYDGCDEHKAQWDEELEALKRHHIELLGWCFPTNLNSEAKVHERSVPCLRRGDSEGWTPTMVFEQANSRSAKKNSSPVDSPKEGEGL